MGYCSSLDNVVTGFEQASQSCLRDVLQRFSRKQVFHAGISNCIPQYSAGCNYLSMSEIPVSGAKTFILFHLLFS